MINFDNREFIKIGRGHDKDVRITDISVSRYHALIKKGPRGEYLLEDNSSKFGTLVQVKKPYQIEPNLINCFQIGRTLLECCILYKEEKCCQILTNALLNRSIKKAAKSSLAFDGEDFFPEEFL